MFEREYVSFGVFSKSNLNPQILETRILYEHRLRVFLTAAPIARGALLKFVSSKRVFGAERLVKRRLLITLGLNSVFGAERCIKRRLFMIMAVLDTHHFRSPPEEGQNFCPPFKHQFSKNRPACIPHSKCSQRWKINRLTTKKMNKHEIKHKLTKNNAQNFYLLEKREKKKEINNQKKTKYTFNTTHSQNTTHKTSEK